MKKIYKILIILLLSWFSVLYLDTTQAVSCTLTGASFSKQTIAIGENVILTVTGQGCSGQTITTNVYGRYGLGKFLVKTVAMSFINNPTAATGTVSFTASDFSGRTGDTKIFLEAATLDNSSKINSQYDAVVKVPNAGSCQLGSAQWQTNFNASPILGSPLHMIVNGAGCVNYGVSFKIYTADTFTYSIDTVNGKFDSTGTKIDVIWTANNKNDNRPVASRIGNYNFYFIASADQSKTTSNQIKIPTNSENGCLNCNGVYGVPMTSVACADGTTLPGGTYTYALTACRNNIGDAQGGNGDSDDGGGDDGGDKINPGADLSFPNPLQTNNIKKLLNKILSFAMAIGIPIAVVMIVYAGIMFLISQGNPSQVTKARTILMYAVIGLAVILIGKGFLTLIQSILDLGNG